MLDTKENEVTVVAGPVETAGEVAPLTKVEVIEAWLEEHAKAAVEGMAHTHFMVYLKSKVEELVAGLEGK